jgi:hypothetical protein
MSADAEDIGPGPGDRSGPAPRSTPPPRPRTAPLTRAAITPATAPLIRSRGRPVVRPKRGIGREPATGCALTVLMIWIGIGAALIDYRLVLASRVYCGAGADPGDVFALNLEMLPRLLIGPAMAYGPYLLVTFVGRSMSPLWRFLPSRALIRFLAVLAGVAVMGALIVFDFAHIGTLAGHPGDSGLCTGDNVPPWWPAWLPS